MVIKERFCISTSLLFDSFSESEFKLFCYGIFNCPIEMYSDDNNKVVFSFEDGKEASVFKLKKMDDIFKSIAFSDDSEEI